MLELTEMKSDGLHFRPEAIQHILEPNHDKCQECPAMIFRQDIPFWLETHKNKKLMVVAQDAGKGKEDHSLNTVFSIHNAHIDLKNYFDTSPRHRRYFELFKDLIGHDKFLYDIYFTDIIKCAYSTGIEGSFSLASCKEDLFYEINEVDPKGLILMGKAAQNAFTAMAVSQGMNLKLVYRDACQINTKGQVYFCHYRMDLKEIFFIPHLIGNLHIATDKKDEFLLFKTRLTTYIQQSLNSKSN